jgi:Glycosyl hydrolase family 26
MNVAQHLKSWTDRTGHVVPVRMLHEFNCPPLSDGGYGGPDYMPRLWRRWVTILRGGDVDGNLRAMGQPALRSSQSVGRNDNLLFVWCILAASAGATAETNWWDYWPGGQWVDICGADMYPSPDDDDRRGQFAMLNRLNDFARNHSKPLCIPEFNWAAHKVIGLPGPTREFLDWIVRHAKRVRFTAQFDTTKDFAVVRRGDPHPELGKLYSNYYNKSAFGGDS